MSNSTIAKNAAALVVSDVSVRTLSAIGALLVVRSLGPRAYGVLGVAFAFSAIVSYLSDLGITSVTIQQVTKPEADVGCVLATVFKVRLALVVGVAFASSAGIFVLYPQPEQRAVMLAVVLPSICGVGMQGFATSYFWATQEMHVTAGLKVASQVLVAVALILAFLFRWPVRGVAAIYGAASLLGGIACLWLVRRQAPRMRGWDPAILKGLTAFTIGGITGTALPQLGPLILQRVAAATEVGYFAAAIRIPGLLYAIPSCLDTAWCPQLFSAGARDLKRHFSLSVDQLKINAILGFGLSLPVALYSRLIVRTAFGPSWEASTSPVLSLLCWMVAVNTLTTPFADALTTKGMQTRRACVYVAALVIGSVLFAVLASTGGARGAAAAAVITQVLLSVALILANPCGRELLLAASRRFLRPIFLASGCVFFIHMLLPDSLMSAALCVATFFLVAVASDIELRAMVRKATVMIYGRFRYVNANL